jgi:hypothetical protein
MLELYIWSALAISDSNYSGNSMVNQMPTPRHSTSGSISQTGLHYPQQISLAALTE